MRGTLKLKIEKKSSIGFYTMFVLYNELVIKVRLSINNQRERTLFYGATYVQSSDFFLFNFFLTQSNGSNSF